MARSFIHSNFCFSIIIYIVIANSVDSYRIVDNNFLQDDLDNPDFKDNSDYVTETLQRLSRSPHHFHSNTGEEFQCSQSKKRNDGEGQPDSNGKCSREKEAEISMSMMALKCKSPHYKTVKLKLPGPNYSLFPSVARVKRCSGDCKHPRACLPKYKSTIKVPVYQVDETGKEPEICVDYELEEHSECECKCVIESRHCTPNQVYEPWKCACICGNHEEKERCLELAYMEPNSRYWDDTTCKCHCIPLDCPRAMVWVPTLCRCAKVADDTENALY